jgi:hypothetical protein
MLNSDIRIYTTEDGKTEIKVTVNEETIWLNQYQLETLFGSSSNLVGQFFDKYSISRWPC